MRAQQCLYGSNAFLHGRCQSSRPLTARSRIGKALEPYGDLHHEQFRQLATVGEIARRRGSCLSLTHDGSLVGVRNARTGLSLRLRLGLRTT